MDRNSKCSEECLNRYLKKIRRISKMDDSDALDELDEFISVLHEDFENLYSILEPDSADTNLNLRVSRLIEFLKGEIKSTIFSIKNDECDVHYADVFKNGVDMALQQFSLNEYDLSEYPNLTETINEYNNIAVEFEEHAYLAFINERTEQHIVSVSSARSILSWVNKAELFLNENNICNVEWLNRINVIKEKCAWFRARKNISAAEVAKGGGNDKKYLKLIGEAEVMLKQDWSQIFPDKPVPKIDT
jgi:hypothetical protein